VNREVSITTALGQSLHRAYDPLDRITSITNPLGGTTTFTYDPDGNLLSLIDPLGHKTSYSYDPTNLLSVVTDPLMRHTSYQHDLNGNLTQITDRRGNTTSLQYDSLDRLTLSSFGVTANGAESTISYAYDAGNRRISSIDSKSGAIGDTFDGFDRLISETTSQGAVSYTYDKAGRRTSMSVAGGSPVSYQYDGASRITQINQAGSTVSFTYDNANRRSAMTLPNGVNVAYVYDQNSRPTAVTYQVGATSLGNLTYAYDAIGRRIETGGRLARVGPPPSIDSAVYDAANELTNLNGTSVTYDADGNMVSDGSNTFTWNARNQLAAVNGVGLRYDAVGRRVKNLQGLSFLYDGANAIQEFSGGATVANRLMGRTDEFFSRSDALGAFVPVTDTLGSVLSLTDSSGAVQTQYTYDSFGNTVATGAADSSSYQYTGRENDGNGLYYYRARYYSPSTGRFISEDPTGFAGGINFYGYANDNPISLIDPFGLSGTLTIYSSGTSGFGNHSWISYTPDGGGTTTYGTWGNNPNGLGNGLLQNLEQGRGADASRTEHLNDAQESQLMNQIQQYRDKGADGWKLGSPCSTFAADAWHSATGETLNTHWGPISNPTTLTQSIINANGGQANMVATPSPAGSSSPYGSNSSSSSGSSGSSVNSSGSSLQ
jgi:RHS repeat-associated protein